MRLLDGIAKHPGEKFEFIEPVGLRLTGGLWHSFGFEFLDDPPVPGEWLPPLAIGKDLFEREFWTNTTSIQIFSWIANEKLPDRYKMLRHAKQPLGFILLARRGDHM